MNPRKSCGFEMGSLAWAIWPVLLAEETHACAATGRTAARAASRLCAAPIPDHPVPANAIASADGVAFIGRLSSWRDRSHHAPQRRYSPPLASAFPRPGLARVAGSAAFGSPGRHHARYRTVPARLLAGHTARLSHLALQLDHRFVGPGRAPTLESRGDRRVHSPTPGADRGRVPPAQLDGKAPGASQARLRSKKGWITRLLPHPPRGAASRVYVQDEAE